MNPDSCYVLRDSDDFLRLDTVCHELLKEFAAWLRAGAPEPLSAEQAGALAHIADRYLRDFVVEFKETGPADEDPGLVRQYLGNWYMIHTLQPHHAEIDRTIEALRRLYSFLGRKEIVSESAVDAFCRALSDAEYYHARLEAFWDLTPEGIAPWREVDDYRKPHRVL